jgi:peptidoglycan/xylan/chitin deacetylase (PgdA/CDA1 family)
VAKVGCCRSFCCRVRRFGDYTEHRGGSPHVFQITLWHTSGRVLLTFDDWAYGDPYRATRVGAYLKSRNIRAAFFVINKEAEKYPKIVPTLRQQGHWVLNHSYSHKNLTQLSDGSVRSEISKGVSSNRLRPPYGAYDSGVASIASSLGYRICTWTVNTKDWEKVDGSYRSISSIRSIVRNAPRSAKVSGVVIGHLQTKYPMPCPALSPTYITRVCCFAATAAQSDRTCLSRQAARRFGNSLGGYGSPATQSL